MESKCCADATSISASSANSAGTNMSGKLGRLVVVVEDVKLQCIVSVTKITQAGNDVSVDALVRFEICEGE